MTALPRASGVQLHLTSLPSGTLGPGRARVRRLAGGRRADVLAGPAARAARPPRLARTSRPRPSRPGAGSCTTPARRSATTRSRPSARAHAYWIAGWEAHAGGRRAVADQVRFDREWAALRAHAARRGVRLFGDVPIYVAPGSADHRAHPELFRDDAVAGVPPDAYSDKGQLWGNPLYDWPALQRRRLPLVGGAPAPDASSSSTSPASTTSAASRPTGPSRPGRATPAAGAGSAGPGGPCSTPRSARSASCRSSPRTSGSSRRRCARLRDALGFPGMAVLQFAFDPDDPDGPHRPRNHREHQVVYTGTHDNDTLRGWWDDARRGAAAREVRRELRGGRHRRGRGLVVARAPGPRLAGAAVHGAGPGRRSGSARRRG